MKIGKFFIFPLGTNSCVKVYPHQIYLSVGYGIVVKNWVKSPCVSSIWKNFIPFWGPHKNYSSFNVLFLISIFVFGIIKSLILLPWQDIAKCTTYFVKFQGYVILFKSNTNFNKRSYFVNFGVTVLMMHWSKWLLKWRPNNLGMLFISM